MLILLKMTLAALVVVLLIIQRSFGAQLVQPLTLDEAIAFALRMKKIDIEGLKQAYQFT